ncbi:hypothetical protein ACUNV4_22820 [Granulosicoccus sp. 3-233]|uniref:hypothetical protein n=1 Tax=Granulosicoccus sp. 3-233 TaxID=3417969 RepID=UPI003D35094A
MKSSLPALGLICTLASTTPLLAASPGCIEEQRTSIELGHALGVLMYDSIVRDYAEHVSVDDVAAGLRHARDRNGFPLPPMDRGDPEADPETDAVSGASLSVADARHIVANWRPQTDQLDRRFLSEYKQRGQQQNSGILTHRLTLDAREMDQLSACTANFLLAVDDGATQVCYLRLRIDSQAVCATETHVRDEIASKSWTYGAFQPDSVIEGWAEAFKLLTDEPLVREKADSDGDEDPVERVQEVLEVLIPPEMAYGRKGIAGKVGPEEALWFVMATK